MLLFDFNQSFSGWVKLLYPPGNYFFCILNVGIFVFLPAFCFAKMLQILFYGKSWREREIGWKKQALILLGILIYGALWVHFDLRSPLSQQSPVPKSFSGASRDLTATQIVPTLSIPHAPGKNLIWSASFPDLWKKIERELTKEPIQLEGAEALCNAMNREPDPKFDLPPNEYLGKVGFIDKGIIPQITSDFQRLFPGVPLPLFPEMVPKAFLAFAFLKTRVSFPLPYFDNPEPLLFVDKQGGKTPVKFFGLRLRDEFAYSDLREQVQVLFEDEEGESGEFSLDLCGNSTPNQIVLASVQEKQTLGATLAYVQSRIAQTGSHRSFGPNDAFLVPNMHWKILHHFSEVEGKPFQNSAIRGLQIDVAMQEIEFRLDKSGVELWTEARALVNPIPLHAFFDHPFLLFIQKREAKNPFFVMWVENPELLQKW
jgi:hypothetical protein